MSSEKNKAPGIASRFLRWFCPPSLYEGIEGDLLEKYEEDLATVGEKRARRRFVWNVIRFFRPGILLRRRFSLRFYNLSIYRDMLKNYLLIAFRNLHRHKTISVINISGLSVSMAVGLLILMVIKVNLSYDQFHPYLDRTYRIVTELTDEEGNGQTFATSPLPLAPSLSERYPFVEKWVRIYPASYRKVVVDGNEISMRGAFTDSSFFEIFDFPKYSQGTHCPPTKQCRRHSKNSDRLSNILHA